MSLCPYLTPERKINLKTIIGQHVKVKFIGENSVTLNKDTSIDYKVFKNWTSSNSKTDYLNKAI